MKRSNKQTKERIDKTILEMAQGLYDIGEIDTLTMKEYEQLNVPIVKPLSPSAIKKIRLREKISQAVFAKILNTSVYTVQDWEQGKKHPRGLSLKVLNLIATKGLSILM